MTKRGRTLIRFEDRYGVATVAQEISMLCNEGSDIEALGYMFENGVGIEGVLRISDETLVRYESLNVERVILVFDLDTDSKQKSQLLPVNKLQMKINNIEAVLQRTGIQVRVEYLPVIYSAETILLYQHLKELKYIPEVYINKYDTMVLCKSVIRVLHGLIGEREVKRCTEYIDTSRILENIDVARKGFNSILFEVLCDLDIIALTGAQAVDVCKLAHRLYESCVGVEIDYDVRGVHLSSNMSVPEMREQVSKYLVGIGVKKQRR